MEHFITDYKIVNPAGPERAVLEDSIMHKGRPVTAGSKILENFVSPIDAAVVTRLETAGITILGKTKMDEFGIAGLFEDASLEPSGAVSAVAEGIADFALCNDYSGAVGQQAAMRGLYYIHPTYGTVSRYGLIPAVCSMDQIGIVCKTIADGSRILSIISGHDTRDGAMVMGEIRNSEFGMRNNSRIRIGVPQNIFPKIPGEASSVGFIGDFETVYFDLKYFNVYAQVMQILCCAEMNGNVSRYDGIKFGYRTDRFADLHELYTKSRTEGFGPDAKLATVIGAMVLSQEYYSRFYDKAMRIRRLIKDSLEFGKYDVILLSPLGQESDRKLELHALPRLCGLPALTVPFGSSWITLVADVRREDILFSAIKEMGL